MIILKFLLLLLHSIVHLCISSALLLLSIVHLCTSAALLLRRSRSWVPTLIEADSAALTSAR
jgi:hypothetical protein